MILLSLFILGYELATMLCDDTTTLEEGTTGLRTYKNGTKETVMAWGTKSGQVRIMRLKKL